MIRRIARDFAVIITAAATCPATAAACACGGTHSSLMAVKGADIIFVGAVTKVGRPKSRSHTNADGSVSVAFASGPDTTTFDILLSYLGPRERQVVIVGNGSDCDEPSR